jgi:hypothetical protein
MFDIILKKYKGHFDVILKKYKGHFDVILKKYKDHINDKTEEHAAYYVAISLTIMAIPITNLLAKNGINITNQTFLAIGIIYIYGLRYYLTSIINYLNSSPIGKGLFTLTAVIVTTVNLSLASQMINHVTKIQSTYFSYTKTLVSILALPITISIALLFGSILFILVAMLHTIYFTKLINFKNILTLNLRPNQDPIEGSLLFGRIFALIAVTSFAALFVDHNKFYENQISSFIAWFSYNFELETNIQCITPDNSKSLMIQDNKVVIGINNKDSYSFTIQQCIGNSM